MFTLYPPNFKDYPSIHHNFMCVSGGVVLIPGLCCLKFLFACNTQLRRVVMCFEIRWIEGINTHGVVPNHNISCLTVSSIHPALQMLQLPMNIKGKGLEILTPVPPPCVSTLCLPAAMHVVRPSPSVSHFRILQL